jgi:hypothetical protein
MNFIYQRILTKSFSPKLNYNPRPRTNNFSIIVTKLKVAYLIAVLVPRIRTRPSLPSFYSLERRVAHSEVGSTKSSFSRNP